MHAYSGLRRLATAAWTLGLMSASCAWAGDRAHCLLTSLGGFRWAQVETGLEHMPKDPQLTWYTQAHPAWPLHPTRNGPIVSTVYAGYRFFRDVPNTDRGLHGYAGSVADMAAVFTGMDPVFSAGFQLEQASAVGVFDLLAQTLNLQVGAHHGTPAVPRPRLEVS